MVWRKPDERDIQIQHVVLEEESDYEQWKTIDTKEKMPDFEDGATMKRGR
jgi:hypothetical protein